MQATVAVVQEARERSDTELVTACRNGDTAAFDELVRRHKDRVYNVLYRFLGNYEDALDVSQEVFVRAYRNIDSFQGRAQVFTWLYSIATNLARNRLRDASRKGRNQGRSLEALAKAAPAVAQAASATSQTPRDAAQAHELEEVLQGCLDALPEHYRLAFVLRTFDEMSYEEIAGVVRCPPGTVKSRLNQARKLLRECLTTHAAL